MKLKDQAPEEISMEIDDHTSCVPSDSADKSNPDHGFSESQEATKNGVESNQIPFFHKDYKLSADDFRGTEVLLMNCLEYWKGNPVLLLSPDSWFLFLPSAFLQINGSKVMNMYTKGNANVLRRLWMIFLSDIKLSSIIDCFKKNSISDPNIADFEKRREVLISSGELESWEQYISDNVNIEQPNNLEYDTIKVDRSRRELTKWRRNAEISDGDDLRKICTPSGSKKRRGMDRIVEDLNVISDLGSGDDSGHGESESVPSGSMSPASSVESMESCPSEPEQEQYDFRVEPSEWESFYDALLKTLNEKEALRRKGKVRTENRSRRKSLDVGFGKSGQLSVASVELLENIQRLSSDNELKTARILNAYKFTVTVKDLDTFSKRDWISDSCIDVCLAMIQMRNNDPGSGLPPIFVVNSCLYVHLAASAKNEEQIDYSNMTQSSADKNIFLYRFAMFPININNSHWCLIVADFQEKSLTLYDGKVGEYEDDSQTAINLIRGYLEIEAEKHKHDMSDWEFHYTVDDLKDLNLPTQKNNYDCGVFLLSFANCLALEKPFNFSEADMQYNRHYFLYHTLVSGKIAKDDWKCVKPKLNQIPVT